VMSLIGDGIDAVKELRLGVNSLQGDGIDAIDAVGDPLFFWACCTNSSGRPQPRIVTASIVNDLHSHTIKCPSGNTQASRKEGPLLLRSRTARPQYQQPSSSRNGRRMSGHDGLEIVAMSALSGDETSECTTTKLPMLSAQQPKSPKTIRSEGTTSCSGFIATSLEASSEQSVELSASVTSVHRSEAFDIRDAAEMRKVPVGCSFTFKSSQQKAWRTLAARVCPPRSTAEAVRVTTQVDIFSGQVAVDCAAPASFAFARAKTVEA